MSIWKKSDEKSLNIAGLGRDALLYKVMPHFLMEIMNKYFRIEIEGLENIPKRGRAIICPNHSGYAGFDAAMLNYHVHEATGRVANVLTHHLWFITKTTAIPLNKLGFIEATTTNGIKYLNKNHLVVLFPEGEYGNFKPTANKYRLQEFKRGFVRMALTAKAPIIPCTIIGAEETHINLKQLKFSKYLRGLVLPLPLNILPLPAKWKIRFYEPIYLPFLPEAVKDSDLVHEIAGDIRERMQKAINRELKKESMYF